MRLQVSIASTSSGSGGIRRLETPTRFTDRSFRSSRFDVHQSVELSLENIRQSLQILLQRKRSKLFASQLPMYREPATIVQRAYKYLYQAPFDF